MDCYMKRILNERNSACILEKQYPQRNRKIIYYYPTPIEKPDASLLGCMHLSKPASKNLKYNSIYIHIPFCKSICEYCSFIKVIKEDALVERYITALKKEIEIYAKSEYVRHIDFSVIFFGGGTPTVIGKENLVDIIQTLFKKFNISENYELTVEGTLSTFTDDMLLALKGCGVNRISMGVQTFDDMIGKKLNLPKKKQSTAEQIINNAYNIGIKEINIDLMYDLPEQTLEIFENDLRKAVKTKITHISLFPMNILSDSIIYKKMEDKKELKQFLDGEKDYSYYATACDILSKNGFTQKTPQDWFREGHTFLLNIYELDYMCDRIGLGVSSLGEINGITYINKVSIPEYIESMLNAPEKLPLASYSTIWDIEMTKYIFSIKTSHV